MNQQIHDRKLICFNCNKEEGHIRRKFPKIWSNEAKPGPEKAVGIVRKEDDKDKIR